ncbi:MAG: DMT family protein [Bacteroidales bacterium]|nr:DMT family protein [Bacteroidales bacterium]
MTKGLYTILLLIVSNSFMTMAWYGHLKFGIDKMLPKWGLFGVIIISWLIAFFEYCAQVPANRLGFQGNGGPFSLMQLKIIQEVITLVVFVLFNAFLFKNGGLKWNHAMAALCMVFAVYFVFKK